MNTPLNILIISTGFPPRNAPGALRPYSWAKYWTRAGHNVTVLTTIKGALDGPLDFSLKNDPQNLFRVIEVDFKFWRLATNSDRKKLTRMEESKSNKTSIFLRMKPSLRNIKYLLGPLFDDYLIYLPAFVRTISTVICREKFDVMITTFPPGACHWTGHWLKKKFGIPWVADFRDPWGMPEEWQIRFSSLRRFIEKAAIKRADLLMAVAPALQKELEKRYGIPCVTVENGFDAEEFDDIDPKKIFPEDGKLRFVYTGAVIWKRNPAPFFAAIQELLHEKNLSPQQIEIIFFGRDRDIVSRMAKKHDLETIVKTPGLVDRPTSLRAQRDADGLLVCVDVDNETMDYFLPVKLFEYLVSGTPVLGIGMAENSTAGKLMRKAGVGFPLGKDKDKIKEFILKKYILQKSPLIEPNAQVINKFNRNILAQKALNYISDIIFQQKA